MKKLTLSEVLNLSLKAPGNRPPNPVTREIQQIAVGESVLLPKNEWSGKNAPNPNRRGMRFSFRTLADDSAWVITRKV